MLENNSEHVVRAESQRLLCDRESPSNRQKSCKCRDLRSLLRTTNKDLAKRSRLETAHLSKCTPRPPCRRDCQETESANAPDLGFLSGQPRSTAKSCNQCKLSWILHKLHESAICARFKMSIWYLQVVDTAYSKVRKSALANSINLGCQKHFWRAISAGRVLGVKGRRVLILYLSLFWCLANLPLISFISEPKHYHLSNEPWHDTFSI